MLDAEYDRVLDIAEELAAAGRIEDATLLARLVGEAGEDIVPAISEEELDRRLEEAEAQIAAGQVTPHEVVWQDILARRRAGMPPVPAEQL
jgi:hypothetical protein